MLTLINALDVLLVLKHTQQSNHGSVYLLVTQLSMRSFEFLKLQRFQL